MNRHPNNDLHDLIDNLIRRIAKEKVTLERTSGKTSSAFFAADFSFSQLEDSDFKYNITLRVHEFFSGKDIITEIKLNAINRQDEYVYNIISEVSREHGLFKKEKHRKILDVKFDGEHLHLDLRVSIPKDRMSPEFIKDMVDMRDNMVNGCFTSERSPKAYINYSASVDQDSEGNDVVHIHKNAVELDNN